MKNLGYLLLWGFASLSCNSTARKDGSHSEVEAVSQTVFLGMGYDTDTFQTRDACATGSERVEVQPQAIWNFSRIENWEKAKREMGYSMDGEYTYGLAKVTAKAAFTRNLQDTQLTSTYLLTADYLGVSKFLNNAEMSENMLARLKKSEEGKGLVRRRCGNSYVQQIDSGGMLRIIAKFRFSDKNVKSNFTFAAGVNAGVVSVNASTTSLTENELKNSSVDIHIHQEGGDFAHLGQVIDPSAAIVCSLDKWEVCQSLIKKILEYSINTFPADIKAGNSRIFSFKTAAYFDVDFEPLPEEAISKRTDTIVAMEKHDYDIMRAQFLLKDRENYTIDDRKHELENIAALVTRNFNALTSNLIGCVEYPADAKRCRKVAEIKLESYDQTRLILGSKRIVGPYLGGGGGEEFEQICRNFMVGMAGTSGELLDQIAVVCDDGQVLANSGSHSSNYYNKKCPDGMVITGLRGSRGRKDVVGSLGVSCSNLAELKSQAANVTKQELVVFNKAKTFTWDCPAGFAAIGFKGRADFYVDALALVCANY